jgi:hypothetical protein
MKWLLRIVGGFFFLLLVIVLVSIAYVKWGLAPHIPQIADQSPTTWQRTKVSDNFYTLHKDWLRKSDTGLWEEYIEGTPFERGVIAGKLTKELQYIQEEAFVEQIHKLVPSDSYLSFLNYFTRIFNRHLEENIPLEYREEIYGESLSAPHDFDMIGTPYDRLLNYHAAHDIGHALQSLALVGCTSFSARAEYTADSSMLIGRNFDFYVGDKFAENKIVFFCKPTEGHKFAMLTWAGMMGCVSGMNDQGLTITLNAAKSDIPTGSATPISILAREILQYAGTIDEAYAIAKKRKTFVSETLMIGSAKDHNTALIEKSPTKTALYLTDKHLLLCTNHYQSDSFKTDKNNIQNIATSASAYRYDRLQELLARTPKLDYQSMAAILRDQRGKGDRNIGMGNEKAMNQLIAHHSIIFQPEKLRFWISTQPFQLGKYVCYDLNKIFASAPGKKDNSESYEADLTIAADTFLLTQDWKNFLRYKELKEEVKQALKTKNPDLDNSKISELMRLNPENWESYYWAGQYYKAKHENQRAVVFFDQALTKEINDSAEIYKVKNLIKACNTNP